MAQIYTNKAFEVIIINLQGQGMPCPKGDRKDLLYNIMIVSKHELLREKSGFFIF
jgi:hypothetical protein